VTQHLQFVVVNSDSIRSINWGTTENATEDAWFDLIAAIQATCPAIVQGVTTNGFLGARCAQEPRSLAVLLNCLQEVDVSLDFADPQAHNTFRGNVAAYGWAIQTLALCQQQGIPRSIVMLGCRETLTHRNLAELFNITARFEAHLRINILRPKAGDSLAAVPYAMLKEILLWILRNYRVVSLCDPLFAALAGTAAADHSGESSLRILPDGSVTPSTYLTEPAWIAANIRKQLVRIDELCRVRPFTTLGLASVPAACEACPVRQTCRGGCKDRRILWYDSLDQADPYCPRRYGDSTAWIYPAEIRFAAKRGPLIHDGYLPTLIFAP
jgi:radical SAM protein with 4Fe4S-binding SPASM domain